MVARLPNCLQSICPPVDEIVIVDTGSTDDSRENDGVGATVQFTPQRGFTPYHEYRLFRNIPRIRFRGIIHETMLPDLMDVAREQNKAIKNSDTRINHFGYEGDQRHKHIRNRELLEQQLAREPDRVYIGNHLGRALEGPGESARAGQACLSGIEAVRTSAAVIFALVSSARAGNTAAWQSKCVRTAVSIA
jgi:hypothetical protein